MTQMREPELVADDLACWRGERLVFDGISFRLSAGAAIVVTGTNGSGKSSLLRLVATLLPPAGGRLLWGTAPVEADLAAHRARLLYIGHLEAIKPPLSPRETLQFWAALRGARQAPIDGALAAFGLEALADWPCRWLSAGQRRRLALARLLVAPAPIWLLDEPLAALDAENQARLEIVIEQHRRAGGRVMLATHQPIRLAGAGSLALDEFAARIPAET